MIRLPSGKSVFPYCQREDTFSSAVLWRRLPHALFVFGLGSTIRPNTNSLFGPLFGAEANTKRIFGTALNRIHVTKNNRECQKGEFHTEGAATLKP